LIEGSPPKDGSGVTHPGIESRISSGRSSSEREGIYLI
jgi:hypothetical protein